MKDKKAIGLTYKEAVDFRQDNLGLIGAEIIYNNIRETVFDLVIVPLTKEGNPAPFILMQAMKRKDIAMSYKTYEMTIYLQLSNSGLSINLFDYLYTLNKETA